MVHEQTTHTASRLPAATSLGAVHLKVASIEESLTFYRDVLGYITSDVEPGVVALSPGSGPVNIVLHQIEGAELRNRRTSGLYHLAILLPERRDLALMTQRLVASGWDIGGASDHGVSEALYLDDPEGNGIEIYVDRPRDQWPRAGERVNMVTERLDFESLFGELAGGDATWRGIPEGTTIGHVHLHVGDLEASKRFYVELLGFDVMQDSYPGALFLAAGGYHHHVGMNTWAGRGVPAPPENATGLKHFTVNLPERGAYDELLSRLRDANVSIDETSTGVLIRDPNGIGIQLQPA